MDDTALGKIPFDVNETELKVAEPPGMLEDPGEYELRLLRSYIENDSEDVVKDVLDRSRDLVDTYSAIALEALASLGDYPTGSIPTSDVELDLPDPPEVEDIGGSKPDRPEYDTPEVGDAPTLRGDIQDIVPVAIEKPIIEYPDAPSERLEWEEDFYVSSFLDAIKAALSDIIYNGGTGLSEAWEQGVYDRAVAKLELAHAEKYEEAERYYASKGHVAPPGALIARLNLLNREKEQQEALIISDIATKQIEIAHEHKKFCLELGQRIEAMLIDDKNKVYDRALEAAKSSITLFYDLYKTQLAGIQSKIDIYKTEVEAEEARVNAITSVNKSLTDTLSAETRAFIDRVNAEFGLVDAVIRMYTAEVGGYEAEVRAEAARIQALVDRYRAQVGAAEVQGQIALGEYEQLVKAILGEIQLKLSSQQEGGRIASQVAASALSALNASASISDSVNNSRGYHEQKSLSMSNAFQQSLSNQLSISYSKGEDARDSYDESVSYNYSASL